MVVGIIALSIMAIVLTLFVLRIKGKKEFEVARDAIKNSAQITIDKTKEATSWVKNQVEQSVDKLK